MSSCWKWRRRDGTGPCRAAGDSKSPHSSRRIGRGGLPNPEPQLGAAERQNVVVVKLGYSRHPLAVEQNAVGGVQFPEIVGVRLSATITVSPRMITHAYRDTASSSTTMWLSVLLRNAHIGADNRDDRNDPSTINEFDARASQMPHPLREQDLHGPAHLGDGRPA